MAKLERKLKLQIPAGQATPAPPLGPMLGQAGVNIGAFVNDFNEQTREMQGKIVRVTLNVYEDRSFDFEVKKSPASEMIKQAAGIKKGSGKNKTNKVATLSKSQVEEIAKEKMEDLSAHSVEEAMRIIEGTCRSMGVEVK